MSRSRLQLLGLGVLCAALLAAQPARAQDQFLSVTRRAYGPNDVGRLVDANWNPAGRARVTAEVATGPGPGTIREVRTLLTPDEASANASAFPAAAAMRRAEANGYVRIATLETVYQVDGEVTAPAGAEGQFYIHAVYAGRVYQRQFYGGGTAVAAAITLATHGEPYASVARSARLMRGYPGLRAGDEAAILRTEEHGTLQGILGSRGRPTGVLVVFRRVPRVVSDVPRGQVTFSPPVSVPLVGDTESGDAYDSGLVRRVILSRRAAFVHCYERVLRLDPGARGTLILTFTVTPEGRAADATATSEDSRDDVTSCARRQIEMVRFPQPPETPARFEVRMCMAPRDD